MQRSRSVTLKGRLTFSFLTMSILGLNNTINNFSFARCLYNGSIVSACGAARVFVFCVYVNGCVYVCVR